jgi:hypothetical protein
MVTELRCKVINHRHTISISKMTYAGVAQGYREYESWIPQQKVIVGSSRSLMKSS